MESEEKSKIVTGWLHSMQEASEKRQWGQLVEAAEQYNKIVRQLKEFANDKSNLFTLQEKRVLQHARKILYQLAMKIQELSFTQESDQNSSSQVQQLLESLQCESTSNEGGTESDTKVKDVLSVFGVDQNRLSITIEKIGMKDPESLFQPFLSISVRTKDGECIEGPYDTSYSSQREGMYIVFQATCIKLRTPTDQLSSGAGIFFELKHYKPSKRSISVKCFSFMELDELKSGPAVLEIYKKPTDFTRQKLELFSRKNLYLHLFLRLT